MSKTVAVFAANQDVFLDRIFGIIGPNASYRHTRREVWTRDVRYRYISGESDLRGYTFDAVILLDGCSKKWDTVKDYIPYTMRR